MLDPRGLLVVAKYQFKLLLTVNFIIAVGLCILTPLIFGLRNLDSFGSSFVLERYVSLAGVILLTPLLSPEQDKNIAELIKSKQAAHSVTLLLRIAMSLLFMILLIVAVIIAMRILGGEFDAIQFFIGTFATAFFLGAIGFAFHAFLNNIVIGYFAAIVYYLLNFSLGTRLGNFWLFSLSVGSMDEKYWLMCAGVLLFVFPFHRWRG